jgi:hypothetical protein
VNGPYHYAKAEEILAEIEAVPAMPDETETALSFRAAAHALLANAAAVAVGEMGSEFQPWMDVAASRFSASS